MSTMDIAHDRAGYYLCWGCLNWIPAVYTSPAMYLVKYPVALGTPLAVFVCMAGLASIYINYDADRQRQVMSLQCIVLRMWFDMVLDLMSCFNASQNGSCYKMRDCLGELHLD